MTPSNEEKSAVMEKVDEEGNITGFSVSERSCTHSSKADLSLAEEFGGMRDR
jgi:hypothetical protein